MHPILRSGVAILALGPALAGGVYWTDRGAGRLMRMNFDGANSGALVLSGEFPSAGSNLRGVAVDTAANRLFWADNGSDTLRTAALDGSGAKSLLKLAGASPFPADVRPDFANGQLWWCDQTGRLIQRTPLDGGEAVTVVADAAPTGPYFLDFDRDHGLVYWGDFSGGAIYRAQFDGSRRELLLTGNLQTRGVGVDAGGGFLYWVNRDGRSLHRCPLAAFANGPITLGHSAVATLYRGLDTPHGLVLDVPAGKLYWADTGTNAGEGFGGQSICRGDLDGKSPAELLASGTEPWDVDLDRRSSTFTEWRARHFRRDDPEPTTAAGSDPDGDGLPNELEYLLGTSPRQHDPPGGWLTASSPDADGVPTRLRFPLNTLASDWTLRLESTGDLTDWRHAAEVTPVVTVDEPATDGISRRTVTLPAQLAAERAVFLRLRVVPIP